MATPILLKKSSVTGKVPLTSDLQYGEVALNYTDGKIFFKDSSNNIKAFLQAPTLDTVTDNGASTTNSITVGQLSIGTAFTLPTTDGAAGQVLTTDGLGTVTWGAGGGGGGGSASDLSVTTNAFSGTGSQTNFTLSIAPTADTYVFVSINGVLQASTTYSVTGTTLSFSEAPASGDSIETRVISGLSASVQLRDYKKFVYNITTTTSTITGTDSVGATLEYDAGYVDVYLNGARLVAGDDYTATNGTSIALTVAAVNTDTVEVLSYGRAYLIDSWQKGSAVLTTTTANQVIDTFTAADFRTAKFICQVRTAAGAISATEILLMHDLSTVWITEYATMYSGGVSLGTFSADLSGAGVRLLFSPANINTTVKVKRVMVEA